MSHEVTDPEVVARGSEILQLLVDRLTDVYNKESNSNNEKLLTLNAMQLGHIDVELDEIKSAHFVEEASGISLDRIGALLNLIRLVGEDDVTYAQRLKSEVSSLIGGGTIAHLKRAIALRAGVTDDVVFVRDGYTGNDGNYGHIEIYIDGLSGQLSQIEDVIQRTKAAGIKVDKWGNWLKETQTVSDELKIEAGFVFRESQTTSDVLTRDVIKPLDETTDAKTINWPFYYFTGAGITTADQLHRTAPADPYID